MLEEKAQKVTTAAMQLLLEPLSQATQTTLAPLQLKKSDRLLIWLSDDAKYFLVETQCVNDAGEVTWWPGRSADATRWYERVPECKWLGARDEALRDRYQLAATDYTALVIYHGWPKDQITFKDENARTMYDFLVKRFFVQGLRTTMQAEFKLTKKVPQLPAGWVEHDTLPLLDYQKAAVSMVAFQPSTGLFMDRGTGKTPCIVQLVCVESSEHYDKTGHMYRVLVVCPPQVRRNWLEEIQRFATVPGKAVIVKGGQAKRIKQLVQGITTEKGCRFSIVIIGYDSLVSSIEHFTKVPWDRVVLDESHWIKSHSTKRWQALRDLRECSRRRIALTGTPIGNSLMDLWTQLEFLGDGLSGFQSYKEYRSFHGVWEDVGGGAQSGIQRLLAVKNVPLLQERLARLTFSITKEEAGLHLPDKLYDIWETEMTPQQTKVYEQVASQLAVEIEDALSGEVNELTVEHILTRLLRLAQITSGFITYDPVRDEDTGEILKERRVVQIDTKNPKVEAVVEMLTAEDRDPLGKTLIWCHWVEDIENLHRRLEELGIRHGIYYGKISDAERDRVVTSYNSDPNFRVMIANPQTAGEGLNLIGYDKTDETNSHTYTDHVIFFSQNWSSILRGQAEDRAHRKGTRMPVRITDLTVLGTIDEEIRKRVNAKTQMALSVMDIREILNNVLNLEEE